MSTHTYNPSHAITLTPAAITHLKQRLDGNSGHRGIRVAVKPSGCSGYAYVLDAVTAPQEGDVSLSVDAELTVFIDPASLPMIAGMQVDYVKDGLNRHIEFRNPNVTGQCGCGESFTVK